MLPLPNDREKEATTSTPSTSQERPASPPSELSKMFAEMSSTSAAANDVVPSTAEEKRKLADTTMVFEILTKMYQPPDEQTKRKKARISLHPIAEKDDSPNTPFDSKSRWTVPATPFAIPYTPPTFLTPIQPQILLNAFPSISFQLPPLKIGLKSEEELMTMKGPTKLIGFLVDIAMDESARRALRWTGEGLEFILVNKELVAAMWGNRKHNNLNMDYLKLSRAIREKYARKDGNVITRNGKLKKGSRTYTYVFTEDAYPELTHQTGRDIKYIMEFAKQIGEKHKDNADINGSSSPQPQSPHSD